MNLQIRSEAETPSRHSIFWHAELRVIDVQWTFSMCTLHQAPLERKPQGLFPDLGAYAGLPRKGSQEKRGPTR